MLYLFIPAVITLLYVDNTVKINKLLREVSKNNNQIIEIKSNNQLLINQINLLQAPDRIVSVAEKKLGLVKPNKVVKVIEAEQ